MIAAIGDSAEKVRKPAQWALENIGDDAVPAVIGVLQQPANDLALACTLKIAAASPESFTQRLPLIATLADHSNHEIRSRALVAVSKIGRTESKAILVKALADSQDSVQLTAAEIIIQLDSDLPEAVTALIDVLASPNYQLRATGAIALARAGGHDPKILQALAALLQDSEPSVRLAALQALTTAGAGCHHVADAIINVIARQDKDECVIAALEALCRSELIPSHALPVLLKAITSTNSEVRTKSSLALAQTGLACCPPLIKISGRVDAQVQKDISIPSIPWGK